MIAQRQVRQFGVAELTDRLGPAIVPLLGQHDLPAIPLLRLHQFLWRDLATREASPDERVSVVNGLGDVFTEAGMDRHAAVCADPVTARILTTYETAGPVEGLAAYREALAATGLEPPHTRDLRWGEEKGPHESEAYEACGRDIEQAITSGTLRVGERRWQVLRAEITDYQLRQGWLEAIHAERREAWAHADSPIAGLRRAVSIQLALPTPPPDDGYPALAWLLRRADSGIELTEDGHLTPDLVIQAVQYCGWREQLAGVLNREIDVPPLLRLRQLASEDMGALERSGSRLELTPAGRRMTSHPEFMHERAVAALLGNDQSELGVLVREAALAAMLLSERHDYEHLLDFITTIFRRAQWKGPADDIRIDEAVRPELSDLFHRMWAIGLLTGAEGWAGQVSLGSAGRAAARAALRHRAIAPREFPRS